MISIGQAIPASVQYRVTIGPPAEGHSNGVSQKGRYRPVFMCLLGLVFTVVGSYLPLLSSISFRINVAAKAFESDAIPNTVVLVTGSVRSVVLWP